MYTFSHGFWTYLIFKNNKYTLPIVIGSMFPDINLFVSGAYLYLSGQKAPETPWVEAILSHDLLYIIDEVFHSFIIWGLIILFSFLFKLPIVKAFGIGAVLHIVVDVFTHQKYPLTYRFPLQVEQIKGPFEYSNWGFTIADISLMLLISTLYFSLKWFRNKKNQKFS